MVNNGYDKGLLRNTRSPMARTPVAFGRPFIANPDLVERLRSNAPWNEV